MLFHHQVAEIFIAYDKETPVGFVILSLTHRNFTLFAKPGLYIHDIYVTPEARHRGVGRKLIHFVKKTAQERNLGRIDFLVLKENSAGIEFYKSMPEIKEVEYIQYMRITL